MSDTKLLHTSLIRVDGGTQMRAELDPATIAEYAQARQAGATFPPIVVYYDGETYWLGDGFHRLAASKKLFEGGIQCEVRSGTRRDAVLCAAGANAAHGLRRTNADKRRAVETLLRDQEWAAWSDREISRRCAVHHEMVGKLRSELSGGFRQIPDDRTVQRNGQTYTMNTAAIAAANEGRRHLPAQTYQATVPTPISQPGTLANEIRSHQPTPTPSAEPVEATRLLTTPETEAVIWRSIRHSGHHTPTDQLAWLTNSTGADFRKLINPGVNFADTIFHDAINSVRSQLQRQVEPAPAPRSPAEPVEAKPVEAKPVEAKPVEAKPAAPPAAPVAELVEATGDTPDEKPDGDEYYTPPYIAEAALQVLGHIDLDPASSALAQTVIKAAHYYTKEEDGLTKPWAGTVWLNPPYSCPAPFVAKLVEEHEAGNVTAAILLVNTGTETQWGQSLLNRYLVCFVGAHGGRRSRIAFWRDDPTQPDNRNRYSQMIFYIGNQPEQFITVFQQFGAILEVKQ